MSQLKRSKHLKIPFEAIQKATDNFKTCIGTGGYGPVYRGQLLISGHLTTVAVKRLYEKYGQGSKEFLTEIELLKGQKHPNLISLLGYCDDGNEKIIVYEYAERGSLDQYIRYDKTSYLLSWLERLQICVDIAHGLDHLHNHAGKHQAIIHRDIKSSNVLLGRDWVAKISDLGFSKLSLAGLDRSVVISHVCGTAGYTEPEYMVTGVLNIESDVFSFGMVLLEILCGRMCYTKDDHGLFLSDYHKKRELHTIVDPNLWQQMSPLSLTRFLSIANGCLHQDRKKRYSMSRAVKELKAALEIEMHQDGKKSGFMKSDDLQGWISKVSFITLLQRRTNVGKVLDIFDLNRDGGLSRKEVAAFLFVIKPGEEQLNTRVDEVFGLYHKYIDDKKGLSYHGLLQYYDDGHSDLDSDIVPLVSESDDSVRRKNMIWLFKKLKSNKYGDLNRQRIGKPLVKVFSLTRKRGLTSGSLFTMNNDNDDDEDDGDDMRDQSACDSEVLELLSKPDDDKPDDLLFTSPESLDTVEPLTVKTILLYLVIAVSILLLMMVLVKLKYMWLLFLFLFNSISVFLNKRKKMH